jgi:type I restriction enzyme S subunit
VKFKQETEFQKTETEIGKIPREWRIVRLIEIAEVRGGKKLPENVESVVFIPMEAVPDNSLYVNYVIRNAGEVKSYVYCEPGDLLVAKITPSFENGKQGIVPYDLPGKFALATTEVYPIKCNNIDKLFLFYLLKYPPIRSKLASLMRGTTGRRRVSREALENTLLPYPPIHEQRRIAEILSTVDRVIEGVDAGVVRLEGLKKALMRELLTGRIRVREENGKPIFYRETEYQDTEIGKIPKEWKIVKLKEILTLRNGKRPTLSEEGWVPVYGANGIMGYTADFLIDNDYTIVIGRVGASGEVHLAQGKIWVSDNALYSEKFNSSKVFMPFLYYLLKDKKLSRFAHKTTHPIITQSFLNNLPIQLPSLAEQQIIADILLTIDGAIELYYKEKDVLGRLKKGLMDVLLTGKVRMRED